MVERSAKFSPCGNYRYELRRVWSDGGKIVSFVGLNPSTADDLYDDPTIRRCIGFAKAWGFNGLTMVNLFAFRATEPADMKRCAEPIGFENDETLGKAESESIMIVAAWGTQGVHLNRDYAVKKMLKHLHALKLTKDGHPSHPLYLKSNLYPFPWIENQP